MDGYPGMLFLCLGFFEVVDKNQLPLPAIGTLKTSHVTPIGKVNLHQGFEPSRSALAVQS